MKGHKAKRQNSMLRGYSTFDLIFASIILFLIFSIGMIVITEIVGCIKVKLDNSEKETMLISLSNWIVRSHYAKNEGGEKSTNVIDVEKVSRSDVENIAREFNLDYLMIDFGDCGERYEYGEMKEERICITRLGIVDGDVCGITICI